MPRSENAGLALVYPRHIGGRLASATTAMRDAARIRRARAAGLPSGMPRISVVDPVKLRPNVKAKSSEKNSITSIAIPCIPKRARDSDDSANDRLLKKRKMNVEVSGVPASTLEPEIVSTVNVGLPSKLGRPRWRDISRQAKVSLHAGLADCPTNYIRDKLVTTGIANGMRKVCASVQANGTVGPTLPAELPIVVKDLSCDLPSHMIAVYGTRLPAGTRQRVTLFPMHNMILATHCANLPPLTRSSPERRDCEEYDVAGSRAKLTVPVVPLCVPHPESFPQISSYLYSKKTEPLMASLLPPPPLTGPGSDSDEEDYDGDAELNPRVRLAQRLARAYDPCTLLARAMFINGVWRNACALGIFEEKLWMTMDVAWEVVLHALRISTAAVGTTPAEMMSSA